MTVKISCCPTCGQILPSRIEVGGMIRQRIFDFISAHPEGVTRKQVIDHTYADDSEGGPEWACGISVMIRIINRKLVPHGLKVRSRGGPGSIYRLVQI